MITHLPNLSLIPRCTLLISLLSTAPTCYLCDDPPGATNLAGTSLVPPSTASQASYGALSPSLTITKAGLPLCSFATSGGYAQLSVLSWASNPYANSNAVAAPLLRFSAMSKQSATSSYGTSSSMGNKRNLLVLSTPKTPVYYITLQFSVKKNFDFVAAAGKGLGRSNYTIPDCTLNAGHKYIPCGSCNVSSFTDFNVTFGCYNSYDICPNGKTAGTSSHRRVLLSQDEYLDDEANEGISVEEKDEGAGFGDVDMLLHRVLQGSTGSTTTGAPISAPVLIRAADDDGGFNSESDVLTYGTLVKSLAAEASKVLTANTPELLGQAIATGRATVVLSFVCSLTGVILLSLVFLARMDAWEKLEKKYVKKEREKVAMRLLAEDLRNDGKGDLGDKYVEQLQQLTGTGKLSKKVAGDAFSEGRSSPWMLFDGNLFAPAIPPQPQQQQPQHEYFSTNEQPAPPQTIDLSDDNTQRQLHFYGDDGHVPTDVAKNIQNDSNDAYSHIAVATSFAVNKFPGDLIHANKRGVLLRTIFDEHEYTSVFTDAPLATTRTDRFLELATDILIALFVSTLFYSVFYPSDQTCPNNITKSTCLAAPSKVQTHTSLCQWDKPSRVCSLNPPPTDTTFTIIVALLCSIICLPFRALLWYMREEITRKDPWNNGVDDEVMKLQEKKELMRKMRQEKEEQEAARTNADAETGGVNNILSWTWKSSEQRLKELNEKEQQLQVDLGAAQFGLHCRKEDNRSELGRLIKTRTKADARELGRLNGANNSAAMWIYDELVSPAEEAARLMADGTRCLQLAHLNDANDEVGLRPQLDTVHTETTDGLHAKTVNRHVQICAIEEFLGLYPDGTPVPLTLRQRLMFGDRRAKLEYKVLIVIKNNVPYHSV